MEVKTSGSSTQRHRRIIMVDTEYVESSRDGSTDPLVESRNMVH